MKKVNKKGKTVKNLCNTLGGHFNPYNKNHGSNNSKERHLGDLGNISSKDILLNYLARLKNGVYLACL